MSSLFGLKPTQMLPTAMIVLSLGAAIVYAFNRNPRMTIYWIASATIIASVTY